MKQRIDLGADVQRLGKAPLDRESVVSHKTAPLDATPQYIAGLQTNAAQPGLLSNEHLSAQEAQSK